jgi:hypothetical protein
VDVRFVAVVPLLAAAAVLALPFWLPKVLRLSVRKTRQLCRSSHQRRAASQGRVTMASNGHRAHVER